MLKFPFLINMEGSQAVNKLTIKVRQVLLHIDMFKDCHFVGSCSVSETRFQVMINTFNIVEIPKLTEELLFLNIRGSGEELILQEYRN